MKKILLLLATLLWLGYWWRWYTCKICSACGYNKTEAPVQLSIQPETGLLLFNKDDSIAMTQVGWARYRDSLISSLLPNQTLTIEGQYLSSEPNNSVYENLGLSRANAIRKFFPDSLQSKIKINSLLVSERPSMNGFPFVASSFSVNTISDKIEQAGDKTLVFFNYNSDKRIKDPEIEKYLSDLAAQELNTRSAFTITGHTDNNGNSTDNKRLGQSRADAIKNFLESKGIAPIRITTKSMGETMPIGDNNTVEGRQKNRRTEIELINKL